VNVLEPAVTSNWQRVDVELSVTVPLPVIVARQSVLAALLVFERVKIVSGSASVIAINNDSFLDLLRALNKFIAALSPNPRSCKSVKISIIESALKNFENRCRGNPSLFTHFPERV
jgi:hypothetical protein